MAEINTNGRADSVITEIKADKYIQHSKNLTQDNQAELTAVKNDFYKTGKDTYNLTVHGKTELDYGYRSRTSNGNVEENAEGNLIEKCLLKTTRVFIGARNSVKIGPTFFTTAVTDARIDIGAHVAGTAVGIGLGVQRVVIAFGATLDVAGVQGVVGMTSVDDVEDVIEQVTVAQETHETVVEEEEDPYAVPADLLAQAAITKAVTGAASAAGVVMPDVTDMPGYATVRDALPAGTKRIIRAGTIHLEKGASASPPE